MNAYYKFKDTHRGGVYGYTAEADGAALPERGHWEAVGTAAKGEVTRKMQAAIRKSGYAEHTLIITNVDAPVPPLVAKKFKRARKLKARAKKRKMSPRKRK